MTATTAAYMKAQAEADRAHRDYMMVARSEFPIGALCHWVQTYRGDVPLYNEGTVCAHEDWQFQVKRKTGSTTYQYPHHLRTGPAPAKAKP